MILDYCAALKRPICPVQARATRAYRLAGLASQDDETPLHLASRGEEGDSSEIVDRLIAARAMVDAANKVLPRTCPGQPLLS